MATVRITHYIRGYVSQQLDNLTANRISKLRERLSALPFCEHFHNKLVPQKDRHFLEQSAAEGRTYGYRLSSLAVNFPTINRVYSFVGNDKCLFPYELISLSWSNTVNLSVTADACELTDQALAMIAEIDAITEENKALKDKLVHGVLTQCTTLRQVLEVWPNALQFMPPETIEAHNRQTEKRTASKLEAMAVDDDTKVMLMKAQMLAETT